MESAISVTSIEAWLPVVLAFGIGAGAINGIVSAVRKSAVRAGVHEHKAFKVFLPILPGLIGGAVAPFIASGVTPVAYSTVTEVLAGILMGSLSTQVYSIWKAAVKEGGEAVVGEIDEETVADKKDEGAPVGEKGEW